jgi:hypothetical protein
MDSLDLVDITGGNCSIAPGTAANSTSVNRGSVVDSGAFWHSIASPLRLDTTKSNRTGPVVLMVRRGHRWVLTSAAVTELSALDPLAGPHNWASGMFFTPQRAPFFFRWSAESIHVVRVGYGHRPEASPVPELCSFGTVRASYPHGDEHIGSKSHPV